MLVKFNPLNAAFHQDSTFDDFFTPAGRGFEPTIDVQENEKDYIVSAELPGLDKKDFKLTVKDNLLVLEGEKKSEKEEKGEKYLRSERSFGAFKRSFRLSDDVDAKKVTADFKNGILQIKISKSEKAKPMEIEVAVN